MEEIQKTRAAHETCDEVTCYVRQLDELCQAAEGEAGEQHDAKGKKVLRFHYL